MLKNAKNHARPTYLHILKTYLTQQQLNYIKHKWVGLNDKGVRNEMSKGWNYEDFDNQMLQFDAFFVGFYRQFYKKRGVSTYSGFHVAWTPQHKQKFDCRQLHSAQAST